MFLSFRDAPRDHARLLPVFEAGDNLALQCIVLHDLLPLIMGIFPADVGLVLRLLRHIPAFYLVPPDFERNRVWAPLHKRRDIAKRVFLFQKSLDLTPFAQCKLSP